MQHHVTVRHGDRSTGEVWITTETGVKGRMDHYHPVWVELPEKKNDGRVNSESGGVSGGGGLGGDSLGQQINWNEEINPDMDPRLRVMEGFC